MGPGHGMPIVPGMRPDMPMNQGIPIGQRIPIRPGMENRLPMGGEPSGIPPPGPMGDVMAPPPLCDPGIISAGRPREMPVGEENLLPPGLAKQLAEGSAKLQRSSNEGSLSDLHNATAPTVKIPMKENKSDSPGVPFLGQKRDDLGPFMGPDLSSLGHLPMGWPQAPVSTGHMFGPITPSANQGPKPEHMEPIGSFLPTFGNLPNPLQMNQSGFPTSVLFPSDLQHPLREESLATNPLPSNPNADPGVPEGSPQTPPNLNMHRPFHFSLDSEE